MFNLNLINTFLLDILSLGPKEGNQAVESSKIQKVEESRNLQKPAKTRH